MFIRICRLIIAVVLLVNIVVPSVSALSEGADFNSTNAATVPETVVASSVIPPVNTGVAILPEQDIPATEPVLPSQQTTVDVPAPTAQVLISKVQSGASSNEFIEIFNQTSVPVDVSGWTIDYLTADHDGISKPTRVLKTLSGDLQPGGYYSVAYKDTFVGQVNSVFDISYSGGSLAANGSVRLVRANGTVADLVGWGSAKVRETKTATAEDNMPLQRCIDSSGVMVDTDNNSEDMLNYQSYGFSSNPSCPVAVAQKPATLCNGLVINEIAANVSGDKQFVELMNNGDSPLDIGGCLLQTNRSTTQSFVLPSQTLAPKQYITVYIKDTPLTLTKTTTGTVYLVTSDGSGEVDERAYDTLKENSAWAQFGVGDWRQTFTLTPGADNVWQEFLPCTSGYERNLETGRCRLIVTDTASIVVPCNAGQYRSPETNRCRSLGASVAVASLCNADQFRNPATGRCKKVEVTSSVAPCKPGQERNPSTNRCRNVNTANTALYGVEKTATPEGVKVGWLIAALVGAGAVAYVVYEWRFEIQRAMRALLQKLHSR